MTLLERIRETEPVIVVQGLHPGIIQSMLDYDVLLGRSKPTVKAIIVRGRKKERFFWGDAEIEIPLYGSLSALPEQLISSVNIVVNVQSARNVRSSLLDALDAFTKLSLVTIFAEGTPELHALELHKKATEKGVIIVGPSSVGILIPGVMKLGAIGGTMHEQIVEAQITEPGKTAVITTSGGMANELIRTATSRGEGISFAVALGGDRFPIFDPVAAVLMAEEDPSTEQIIFFGELGGDDEHIIAELIKNGTIKKKVICYIAGVVAELFETPPQFGHAKALAQTIDESASSKKEALRVAGAVVCDRFDEIAEAIGGAEYFNKNSSILLARRKGLFMSHISGENKGAVQLLGRDLLDTVENNSVASLSLSLLLGRQVESKKLIEFTDFVMRLLVDHSPNVSGAVNTMIAARAGRDLVSSLSAGILTIGPRFGGAINEAASGWLEGVSNGVSAKEHVETYSKKEGIISGIGHKKYRLDLPDPRVTALKRFENVSGKYFNFAHSVELFTTTKKANLILNVDGAIAAIMLDLLSSEMELSDIELRELVSIEFFNALFVISRTIGFTAHYLDQRRNDEGLFRLPEDDLRYIP